MDWPLYGLKALGSAEDSFSRDLDLGNNPGLIWGDTDGAKIS